MKLFQNLFLGLVILASFFVTACQSGSKGKQSEKKEIHTTEIGRIEKIIEDFVYPLPSTSELSEMIKRIDAAYTVGIINDAGSAQKYQQEVKQAINLGVYLTDISYLNTYNQQSLTPDYIRASETLIREMDLGNAYSKDMVKRIESSIDDKEKLTKELTTALNYSYAYLRSINKDELALLVMYGSWIEGMYLTLHVSESTYENIEVINTLVFQEKSLTTLLKETEKYKANPACKNAYINLENVKAIFDMTQDDGAITEEQLSILQSTIAKLRNDMVSY